MLMRPSARARGPPGQEWAPRPKARCSLALGRSTRNSAGHSNRRGSRLAAPFSSMTGVPGAMSTPPTRGRPPGQSEIGLHRALDPQRLLDEVGDALPVGPELVLEVRILGQVLERGGQQASGRLLTGGKEERGRPHDRSHLGSRSVGILGHGQVGQHVVAGLTAPVLDVAWRTSHRASRAC